MRRTGARRALERLSTAMCTDPSRIGGRWSGRSRKRLHRPFRPRNALAAQGNVQVTVTVPFGPVPFGPLLRPPSALT